MATPARFAILMFVLVAACAGPSGAPDGGVPLDAGPRTDASAGDDAGLPGDGGSDDDAGSDDDGGSDDDAGSDDDGLPGDAGETEFDAGTARAGTCQACSDARACLSGAVCALQASGDRVCLPACVAAQPECPPRFDCVLDSDAGSGTEGICRPTSEACCVDADGDLHGAGVGCLGPDCDDAEVDVFEPSAERCDGKDNDCDGEPDNGTSESLCPHGPQVAASACTEAACRVVSCDPGAGDCDGAFENGCETSTTTNADCAGCGVPCAPTNAIGDCSTGACRIVSCTRADFDDCDGLACNGCETSLRSPSNCAACGITCALPGTAATCSSGVCSPTGCVPGLGNCDGVGANGCEQPLNNTVHCGDCHTPCAPANGVGRCSAGTCTITSCSPGFFDCDGRVGNGCEAGSDGPGACDTCGGP